MTDTPAGHRPQVGIVLISHSRSLAEGAADVAAQIAPGDVSIVGVGGTDDGRLGTDFDALATAIDTVAAGDGVVVIPDLGSSVLTTRTYLADLEGDADEVTMVDTAFVEGAVAAALAVSSGKALADVVTAAEEGRHARKF